MQLSNAATLSAMWEALVVVQVVEQGQGLFGTLARPCCYRTAAAAAGLVLPCRSRQDVRC